MRFFNYFKPVTLPGIIFLLSAFLVNAQTSRPNLNRLSDYDVQHYILRVKFDAAEKKVFGDTTIIFQPTVKELKTVEFDAVKLNFESVRLEGGAALKFRTDDGKISVSLDRPYAAAETIAIRFVYSTEPQKGVYFVPAQIENGKLTRAAQIWTQGEPDEARHWFPSFDAPNDKATTEEYITAQKGETVIGNGEFLAATENADGTVTHHFKTPFPHSTYLVSFVIGKYVKTTDQYKTVPLASYLYEGSESLAVPAFGGTKDMMGVYENLTGISFPYNKYDQTIVAEFNFGGMENITATTLADTEIFAVGFAAARQEVEDLVSHELAHSWFGNLVTCKNWSELWLNEGFATFMEAAYREKAHGRSSYLTKIKSDARAFQINDATNRKRHALFNQSAKLDDSLFDVTTYQKGGVVLHMLRENVGDQAFWKGVNIYLNRHKFANVETPDLQRAMEEASGEDLKWFFDQWVYAVGSPSLDIKPTFDRAKSTLRLTITQTQKTDGGTPAAFVLPLDIEIKTDQGSFSQKIRVSKKDEAFDLKIAGRPLEIMVDKDEKIPLKRMKIAELTASRNK